MKIDKKQLTTTPYIIVITDFYEKILLVNRQLTVFKHYQFVDLLSDYRFQSTCWYYSEKWKSISRQSPFSNSPFLKSVFKVRQSPFLDIFHPLLNSTLLHVYFLSLWHVASPTASCYGSPSPSDPMESVCRYFPPLSLYAAMSEGLLPRQPVSFGSDRVRLPTFSTPFTILYLAVYF